jgi:ABC-type branched-subunit amino acid transport system substrate-binding protein
MQTIKQKILKSIISLLCVFCISSCDQAKNLPSTAPSDQNITDVAILLPFTGNDASISKEYANMVKLGIADGTKTKIRVTTYDSTTQEKLLESINKILDSGTDIVIGPVYSEETKIVAQKVENKGSIVLSLSNNPILASSNVYICGHAPMRQLEKITNYFLDNGYQDYIALLPSGAYSTTINQILNDLITNRGGAFAKVEFYGELGDDIAKSVNLISEYVDNLNENDFNLKRPVVLLSDDSTGLRTLYKYMKSLNLDKKSVLSGDSRIDIDYSPHIDLTFTGSINMQNQDLVMRTRKLGIKHISFMHAVAYDMGKMTGQYIGDNYNRVKFLARINSPEKFDGISGRINFIDSIAQREYEIIKKENGIYKKLEEKPVIEENNITE